MIELCGGGNYLFRHLLCDRASCALLPFASPHELRPSVFGLSLRSRFIQDEEVTIFGHFLHMHQAGQHMVTRQYRGDQLIHTSVVEYFSFDQAAGFETGNNSSEIFRVSS